MGSLWSMELKLNKDGLKLKKISMIHMKKAKNLHVQVI